MEKNVTKIGLMAVMFAASAIAFTACNKKVEKVEEAEGDSIVVVEEIPVSKDYTAYTFEQKNEVVADAKAELDAINKKIDELKAEAAAKQQELSAEAKSGYDNAIKELEQTRDGFKVKVDELEKSTAETWEATKTDVANAYNTAAQGVENTFNKAKDVVSGAVKNAKDAVNSGIDSVQNKLLK